MFVLGKDHEYYYVATGNEIENKHVVHLNDKLSRVNALDKNGLKEWYDGIIKNNSSALNKSDQGIGIIDMALKSENKFEFDFKKLNDENSFFTLKIKVKAEIE